MSARAAAAILGEQAPQGSAVRLQKARVTGVTGGLTPSVNLLVDDRWAVERVLYLKSYAAPAVGDAVYVLSYGPGRRVVLGEEA